MGRETRTTIRDVTVAHNTVTGNTIAESTVQDQNCATVFHNTVPGNILIELSTASQVKSTKNCEKWYGSTVPRDAAAKGGKM